MSALSWYKKRVKKRVIYKKGAVKKNDIYKKREGGFSSFRPLLLQPRPRVYAHYLCVRPSLVVRLRWTMSDKATAAAASKFLSTHAAGKNT